MSTPARLLTVSVDEYLSSEEASEVKHEYVNGQVYAMVGASQAHSIICVNIVSFLRATLRGGACRVFASDLKVKVEQSNSFYYPDVLVDCGQLALKSSFASQPVFVAEVLSPSTMDIDKREKLAAYRTVNSLKEYLIVYQDEKKLEYYAKDPLGNWTLSIIEGLDENIILTSFSKEVILPLRTVYEDLP